MGKGTARSMLALPCLHVLRFTLYFHIGIHHC
jgi:hypothetical protein